MQAERAVSRALGGSCSMPLAAHARWQGGTLALQVALGHAQTLHAPLLRAEASAAVQTTPQARALGARGALLREPARRLPGRRAAGRRPASLSGRMRVIVTRPAAQAADWVEAAARAGDRGASRCR